MAVNTNVGDLTKSVTTEVGALNETLGEVERFLKGIHGHVQNAQKELGPLAQGQLAEAIRNYNRGRTTTLKPRTRTARPSRMAPSKSSTPKTSTIPMKAMVQQWAETHDGTVDIEALAKTVKPRYGGDMRKAKAAVRTVIRPPHYSPIGDGIFRWSGTS